MPPENNFSFIKIDGYSATPKYLQLTNAILNAIESGKLHKNEILPSINELSYNLDISRDTVEKGYRYLKTIGVLGSVPGKGYFIMNAEFRQKLKIFLLFNKLSAHKKVVYDAFVKALGDGVAVHFYIYNNDFTLFKKLLEQSKDDYSHYVIITHFLEEEEEAYKILNSIPSEKLVLLDKLVQGVKGKYAAVYENFEKDIYYALEQALPRLSQYQCLKIIFPKSGYFPKEIIRGFIRFCQQYAFLHSVVNDIAHEPLNSGEVYICLMEDDLVVLSERLISQELKVGLDVGVISYNETPLKKIILNGITTISTDFKYMGQAAARVITENVREHIEVPFNLTLRASL
ncbi:MAG TPA: GntR family transcriptional regulator [Sphingobacteriaceae bacterium]